MESGKKYAMRTTISHIVLQVVLALSGLIVPKLILSIYGSTMNGLINSITQFLTYVALVEAGIGNAAIVALYQPLATSDHENVNKILAYAKKKYLRAGFLYLTLALLYSFAYAFWVRGEVDITLAFEMVLLIAFSYAIDYLLIGKYKVLLVADQKYYIVNFFKGFSTLFTMLASIVILLQGQSVLLVKVLAVVIRIAEAWGIAYYVRKKYDWVHFEKDSGEIRLGQQKNALVHQIASVVIYNTDLVVLTLCLTGDSLKENSVYTVYAMTFGVINNVMVAFTNGVSAMMGRLNAQGQINRLNQFFGKFEAAYMAGMFLLYTCYAVLAVPFTACYTKGVTDVNYIRYIVALLFAFNGITCQMHDPAGTLILAAGRFKETQKYVIIEAIANIVISLALVFRYGIVGVLIGTLIGHIISAFGLIGYANRSILKRRHNKTIERILRNGILMILVIYIELPFIRNANDWLTWVLTAAGCFAVNCVCFGAFNLLFEFKQIGLGFRNKDAGKNKK